jgi:response regulator RpfG family c-di-GMP phosphodiesterase/DNA-binding CsgD family transcriptional regulator
MSENTVILVIDDEPSNIQVVINVFQAYPAKYKILSTSNSVLGCRIAGQSLPDLIILDWEMPEMTGIDVIKKLKSNDATKDIPIVMATGVRITSVDLQAALEAGAVDYIRKPLDEVELISRVNSALKITEYYKNKIEYEKKISSLTEEALKLELDIKKKELVSKTMLHVNLAQHTNAYLESINRAVEKKEHKDCEVARLVKEMSQVIEQSGHEHIWKEFEYQFAQVHGDFYSRLLNKFADLTLNERKLCAFLRLNLNTKDIASITFQSVRSIEIARTRLREKFGLKATDTDLYSFLQQF